MKERYEPTALNELTDRREDEMHADEAMDKIAKRGHGVMSGSERIYVKHLKRGECDVPMRWGRDGHRYVKVKHVNDLLAEDVSSLSEVSQNLLRSYLAKKKGANSSTRLAVAKYEGKEGYQKYPSDKKSTPVKVAAKVDHWDGDNFTTPPRAWERIKDAGHHNINIKRDRIDFHHKKFGKSFVKMRKATNGHWMVPKADLDNAIKEDIEQVDEVRSLIRKVGKSVNRWNQRNTPGHAANMIHVAKSKVGRSKLPFSINRSLATDHRGNYQLGTIDQMLGKYRKGPKSGRILAPRYEETEAMSESTSLINRVRLALLEGEQLDEVSKRLLKRYMKAAEKTSPYGDKGIKHTSGITLANAKVHGGKWIKYGKDRIGSVRSTKVLASEDTDLEEALLHTTAPHTHDVYRKALWSNSHSAKRIRDHIHRVCSDVYSGAMDTGHEEIADKASYVKSCLEQDVHPSKWVGKWHEVYKTHRQVYKEDVDQLAEAIKPSLKRKALEAMYSSLETAKEDGHSSTGDGHMIFRRGYFYRSGSSQDYANKVSKQLADAGVKHEIVDHGDQFRPFRGGDSVRKGSHMWAKVKLHDQ